MQTQAIIIITVLGLGSAGCGGNADCDPAEEEFSLEEVLTSEEWDQIADFWGAIETEEHYCRWACDEVYRRTRGWELSEMEECVLDVEVEKADDSGSNGSVVPLGATVRCEGFGTEYACEDG